MTPTPPGSASELAFWRDFVKTERFKNWCKDEPNPELGEFMTGFIREHCPKDGWVLDCGSGVVSILNGLCRMLIATDVLGKEYAKMLPKGMDAPVAVGTEDLDYTNAFDIVHMRNALDHCQNPAKAYTAMLRAVKPGGYLIIHGFENEATSEKWEGMHQWDINVRGNRLSMFSKEHNYTLDGEAPHLVHATTETLPNGKNWMTWIVRK